MVTLFVGESRHPFYVHRELLCDASSFFKAAFTGEFKEKTEQSMDLPEDDVSIFRVFVDFLYHQRYEMLPDEDDDAYDDENVEEDYDACDEYDERDGYLQAFRLYVLAEKYFVLELKKLVIETLLAAKCKRSTNHSYRSVHEAYKHTSRDSGLRRLIADWWASFDVIDSFTGPATLRFLRLHPEFSVDLNVALANLLVGDDTPIIAKSPDDYIDEGPRKEK